jgi:DNA-binding NarL/FixJ family response regulator
VNQVRVLIVADDPLARAGLAAMLADQPECVVTGQVSSGADLARELEVYRPDLFLWDLGWDPTLALDRLTDQAELGPPVVALLSDRDQARAAWSAGVGGLLLRDLDAAKLASALSTAAQGILVMDPALAPAVLSPDPGGPDPLQSYLTPRELEVLRLLAQGLPNKGIADRLGISEHTVKFHVNAIMGKLGVQSRTEAVIQATRRGLVLL